jgi:uncharacterized NAD(P)/FAD-binding protein YdhS
VSDPGRDAPLRVAIVGLGPKGLFALERLLDRARAGALSRAIEVEAFEPHETCGAGPVYDPGQPGYLRMNFSADRVDAWPAGSRAVPDDQRLSFEAWRSRQPELGDDAYPPRAHVGRYLADCLDAAIASAPAGFSVRVRPVRVTAIEPNVDGWAVRCRDGEAGFDEVIVATGHASDWTGALRHGWDHAVPLAGGVFPVEQMLSVESVPPGSRVAARGFALTFIDMALALTEGRGGEFELVDDGRLHYFAGGNEPAAILPFSRTGRPMLAKPDPGASRGSASWERAAADAGTDVLATAGPDPIGASLVPVVETLAGHPGNPAKDPDAALGAAWRAIYPAVVLRFGGEGLTAKEWPAFHALAAEMERVAFGPPPINVAKVGALVDAGLVDTTHAGGGRIETIDGVTELCSAAGRTSIDVVVDAVLPPPGAVGVDDPVVGQLIAAGHARVLPGRRGIEVAPDASCVGTGGSRTPGLAACGRPTEDSVIGNDTLSRELHPQLDRWAERVIERAREPVAGGVA